MKAEAVISRLKPGTQGLRDKVDHAGSAPGFSVSDAAAATAGMPMGAKVLLEMIHAGGHDTPRRTMRAWAEEFAAEKIRQRGTDRRFQGISPQDLVRLVDSVVYELISPKLCQVCLGRGGLLREHLLVTCEQCKGKGTGVVSDKVLRKVAGFDGEEWRARWRHVHRVLSGELDLFLSEMKAEIERRTS